MTNAPMVTPLKAALRESRKGLLVVAVFSMFINILVLTSTIYMMQVYDRVLTSGRVETLVFLTLIAGVAILVMGGLEVVRGRLFGRIGRWLDRRLTPELIAASMRGSLYGLSVNAQPLRDLQVIRGFLTSAGVNALFDAPWCPLFLVVIWVLHPLLGMIGLGFAILLFMIAILNEFVSRSPLKEAGVAAIANTQKADAAIRNADVFHAMGMLPGFLAQWRRRNETALSLQLVASDRNAILLGFSKFFRVFVQVLILGVGAYLVLRHELTSGGMIAASIVLGRALAPVEQAIAAWRSIVAARDAYDRLQRLLERLPTPPPAMPLPPPTGRLSCDQLFYAPRGREQPVLQGVTFAIAAGELLGVIGPSAAGKSTLCRLLVGSWQPTRGHVRLDGADVFSWPSDQLGPYLGYLPQDVELYSGTVRDNIARLADAPDSDAVVEAAMVAGVHDMILKLPQGYETEIGDSGSFLSGGQRQRIGLARALYGKPRLIVLDEPNASLDSEGEDSLIGAMLRAKGWGASVVIVAHQPRILQPVDKLLLLRDGRVELFGPRDEVLAKLRASRPSQARPQAVAPRPGGASVAANPGSSQARPAAPAAEGPPAAVATD